MKCLLFFLLGAFAGAFAYNLYVTREAAPPPSAETETAAEPEPRTLRERTADAAANLKESLAEKAKGWRLAPDEIKRDLEQSGNVVREKAGAVGGKIVDAHIVTVIKAKYVLDQDLSALDINVSSTNGNVTLIGTAGSTELIAKAVLYAMDTDGVVGVTSKLTAAVE